MKNKGVFAHGNVWALIMCTACLFCVWNKCSCTALYFHATEHGENDYHPRENLFLGCVYYEKLCLWDQVSEINSGNWVATVFWCIFFLFMKICHSFLWFVMQWEIHYCSKVWGLNRVGLIDVAIVHRRWLDRHHDYEPVWWYQWVIILYIICGHHGVDINMQGIEITFEYVLAFYFQDSISRVLCV